jgi:hypothetical protein
MNTNPLNIQSIYRIHSIDSDTHQGEERQKRRTRYQGREWMENEQDEIGLLPVAPVAETKKELYPDVPEAALQLFQTLTTLEEKLAQLCFFETKAFYEPHFQKEAESMILSSQVGGLFFSEGELRREEFLIRHYQKISKTPLLFAHSFALSLSYFFPYLEKSAAFEKLQFSEIGRKMAEEIAALGVRVQLDDERLTPSQQAAFRYGVKQGHGIVGSLKTAIKSVKSFIPISSSSQPLFSDHKIQDAVGRKNLTFLILNEEEDLREQLLKWYQEHYDALLIQGSPQECFRILKELLLAGKIREELIDMRILKILSIKV